MTVEVATYINQLDPTYPTSNDPKSEGDNHLRLIKQVIKDTFPNVTGPVTKTQAELNAPAASVSAFKNKIINGKMEIAQRGASFAGLTTANTYTLDRWESANTSAAVYTVTQQADVPSSNEFQNSYRFAVTTADATIAAGDVAAVQQRIEGYNVRDLIGKTFALSFWVRSSKTGTHCVAFRNSAPDRSYVLEYSISAANTWEYKTVTVSGGLITAGTWNWSNGIGLTVSWALAAGSTFQTTAGAWQTGSFLGTANQVNCLDTIGNIFAITGVQLEVGSVATPFEHRPFAAELALCQRYFEKSYNVDVTPGTNTFAGVAGAGTTSDGGGFALIYQRFKVSKRAAPTISTWTSDGISGQWNYARSGASGNTVATVDFVGAEGFRLFHATGANWTTCNSVGHWTASIEL